MIKSMIRCLILMSCNQLWFACPFGWVDVSLQWAGGDGGTGKEEREWGGGRGERVKKNKNWILHEKMSQNKVQ